MPGLILAQAIILYISHGQLRITWTCLGIFEHGWTEVHINRQTERLTDFYNLLAAARSRINYVGHKRIKLTRTEAYYIKKDRASKIF